MVCFLMRRAGDLDESERQEVQLLSDQIREEAKKEIKKGENLRKIFLWKDYANRCESLSKKLANKLQKEELQNDSKIARKELEAITEICKEKLNRAYRGWINPFW